MMLNNRLVECLFPASIFGIIYEDDYEEWHCVADSRGQSYKTILEYIYLLYFVS
jgi:hypothetical protein